MNAHERLASDPELQTWWQSVLDDPRTALIFEAAKTLLEQNPTSIPPGASVIELLALQQAAGLGARTALHSLTLLGLKAITEAKKAEAQMRVQAEITKPSRAGMGYGEKATGRDAGKEADAK